MAWDCETTVTVFVTALLCLVTGRAPEDADPFCLGELSGISPPVYPPNSHVLLDSFNYFNLLPPQDGPVWQEVDLDENNVVGSRTSVSQYFSSLLPDPFIVFSFAVDSAQSYSMSTECNCMWV